MLKSKLVTWDRKGSIGILRIENTPKNYIEHPEFVDLDKLKEWTQEPSLRGIIISGTGRNFSMGANVEKIYDKVVIDKTMESELEKGRQILDYIEGLKIPSVAAIFGGCFGAGLEIALACHIRVASENAYFSFPESNLGLMPGFTGSIRLTRKIGFEKSLEYILSGQILNAKDAMTNGIVEHIVAKKEVLNYSIELIKRMTDNRSIEVVNSIITSLTNARYLPAQQAMQKEAELFCGLAEKVSVNFLAARA